MTTAHDCGGTILTAPDHDYCDTCRAFRYHDAAEAFPTGCCDGDCEDYTEVEPTEAAPCSFCGADGARMGHDPAREADGSYDPCVGEPICERCRDSLELDADDCCDGCDSDSSEEAIR